MPAAARPTALGYNRVGDTKAGAGEGQSRTIVIGRQREHVGHDRPRRGESSMPRFAARMQLPNLDNGAV